MNLMKVCTYLLPVLAIVALPFSGPGKDIYVAQTATGNGNGSDAGDPFPSSWFNDAGNWGGGTSQVNPGDVVHLVGTFTNSIAAQGGGAPGNRITILFEPGANITQAAGSGILLGNNNYITVDGGVNGLIQNTANGTALANQVSVDGIASTPSIGNITVKNLTMTNLFVHTPGDSPSMEYGCGVFISGTITNIDVHGCNIAQIQHGILLDYQPGTSSNWNICSNTCLNCSWGIGVGSGNNNSMLNGLNICKNRVSGQTTWDTANNYYHENAIYAYAELPGASITNITIARNNLGPDDGTHATAIIFLSASAAGSGGIWNVNIFNNVLYSQTTYVNCGFIYLMQDINNVNIINNTFDGGTSLSPGIVVFQSALVSFYNNIVSDAQEAVKVQWTGYNWNATTCLNQMKDGSGNSLCNYNSYYNLTGGAAGWGGDGGGAWVWWQMVGFDLNSQTNTPPNYVNAAVGNFHIQSANGIGTNLTSLGIAGLNVDKDGNPRPATGAWDAGAYQYLAGSAQIPAPPSSLQIVVNH